MEGVELCGALLHFLSKEAPSRLEPYLDSDVIALAHFWLVPPPPFSSYTSMLGDI